MHTNSLYNLFTTILKRDLMLGMRRSSELVNSLVFFLIVVTMFPFALGTEATLLRDIYPGVIWVAALLSATMSLERMFNSDFEDGSLEQMLLSHHSTTFIVMIKIVAHWLLTGVPLIVASIFLGFIFGLSTDSLIAMLVTLLLGTPVLSLAGSAAMALTVGLRGGGMLLSLIILPLYIPLLIFSVAAVDNASQDLGFAGEVYFISAILVLALTLAPFATAFSLRIRFG